MITKKSMHQYSKMLYYSDKAFLSSGFQVRQFSSNDKESISNFTFSAMYSIQWGFDPIVPDFLAIQLVLDTLPSEASVLH